MDNITIIIIITKEMLIYYYHYPSYCRALTLFDHDSEGHGGPLWQLRRSHGPLGHSPLLSVVTAAREKKRAGSKFGQERDVERPQAVDFKL